MNGKPFNNGSARQRMPRLSRAFSRATLLAVADCGDAVSPDPAINLVGLPAHGALIVACSDGVWDSIDMRARNGCIVD